VIHVAHVPADDLVRRLIIAGDASAFIAAYCLASESLRRSGITPRAWDVRPLSTCSIDLGGMCFEGAARQQIVIDGDTFEVSLEHAAGISGVWSVHGSERVPGWWRTTGWHWFYVMPVPTYTRVKAWLDFVADSPEAAAERQRIVTIAKEAGVRQMLPPRAGA